MTALLFTCFFNPAGIKRANTSPAAKTISFQDTIPPLSSIAEADIDTVIATYKTKILTIKLKDGKVYQYNKSKWDLPYQEMDKLPNKIKHPLGLLHMVFTRAEHMPEFPGGQEAWNTYMKKFLASRAGLLKDRGHAAILVQFIVDNEGNIYDVKALTNANAVLPFIAEDAVSKSGNWLPAIQNGFKVVCYQKIVVKL